MGSLQGSGSPRRSDSITVSRQRNLLPRNHQDGAPLSSAVHSREPEARTLAVTVSPWPLCSKMSVNPV